MGYAVMQYKCRVDENEERPLNWSFCACGERSGKQNTKEFKEEVKFEEKKVVGKTPGGRPIITDDKGNTWTESKQLHTARGAYQEVRIMSPIETQDRTNTFIEISSLTNTNAKIFGLARVGRGLWHSRNDFAGFSRCSKRSSVRRGQNIRRKTWAPQNSCLEERRMYGKISP